MDSREKKFVGCMVGGAIGDAMGAPVEFMTPQAIRAQYGPEGLVDFLDTSGRYTDDTQLAECVARSLLDVGGSPECYSIHGNFWTVLPELGGHLARRFSEWSHSPQGGHRAPGGACMSGCGRLVAGEHWTTTGGRSEGGCGSVMRVHPCGLVASSLGWATTLGQMQSLSTHQHPGALAACAAMAAGIRSVADPSSCPDWMRRGRVLNDIKQVAWNIDSATGQLVAEAIGSANSGIEPEEMLGRLEGWNAWEAVAAAAYIYARHPTDFEAAVIEGANTPGDSDSIASMAGALVGGHVGIDGIPQTWREHVERGEELTELALRMAALCEGASSPVRTGIGLGPDQDV